MKKIFLFALSLVLIGMAGPVLAEKKPKSTILHCGCVYDAIDGAGMEYKELNISSKSRGHDGHIAATMDSCYSGTEEVEPEVFVDQFTDFVRLGDDCQIDGPPLGDPIGSCFVDDVQQVFAGDVCGEEPLL